MTSPSTSATLANLGVDPDLIALYELVRPMTGQPVEVVATALGADVAEVRGRLVPLGELGLVTFGSTLEVRTVGQAVAALVAEQAEIVRSAAAGLERIRRAIPVLQEEQQAARPPDAEVIHGASVTEDNVEDVLVDWISRCQGDIWWLRPGPFGHHDEGRVAVAIRSAIDRGVRSRAIYPVLAMEQVPEVVFSRVEAGEEVRFVAELPGRMAMVGGIGAMFPEPWRGPAAGLPRVPGNRRIQLHQPALLSVLDAYFEELWARAVVLPGLHSSGASRAERTSSDEWRALLLEQLVDGAKDEQIARALGVSLRTVRRRIAILLDDLGVDTRFQAGVEAVRRGLL